MANSDRVCGMDALIAIASARSQFKAKVELVLKARLRPREERCRVADICA
mgnify:FL=1